ncbi:hypothetical protein EVB94_198 [Rhizobium phage RHph_TM40]|uniref:Uncharacterized protein n=1 Tax=Rhizobium phage RHph_TM30 TaxID=2509764 RepID=A0A7S5R544_9CAUD|nr:hypothetical protein PQC16_gp199 [Rhizobium phage RHph_TM30]QIG71306.1 hypothetical protein EVB93_199 [Rhizobium phage RHph_TM30]QIG71669.1 hypothetical protein EVB94_198 [Rhizobium phage RHph_TM40]QIG77501.1 hypothetical protein EVB61_173 [Rhizobium phage RHph_TM21B]QIG77785.1 hypothetical protein EVB64_198 [Rhizobium phage RHph_TM61]
MHYSYNLGERFDRARKIRKFEDEVNAIAGPRQYQTKKLTPCEQYICRVCNGTNQVEETGDLHRSAGIIPCPHMHCVGGIVVAETIEIKRRVRVKAISRRSEDE